jgi:hypothetical protein
MIAVLTVMSDMDLSHDQLGFWLGWFGLDLVGLVMVCSRYEACVHVLATGGMPVSVGHLWPQVRLL